MLEKISHDGGSILFGWTIWEWPGVLLTAEFHAVWVSPNGDRFDITPKPQKETEIAFVPDTSYPSNFGFDERPTNRRLRTYPDQDLKPLVLAKIGQLKPKQCDYETSRALRANQTLEDWIASKIARDPVPGMIDRFITLCNAREKRSMKHGQPEKWKWTRNWRR